MFPLKTTIGKKEKESENLVCILALVFLIKNEGLLPHTHPKEPFNSSLTKADR